MLKNIFLLITRFHLQTQTQVLRDPLSQIILKLFLFSLEAQIKAKIK